MLEAVRDLQEGEIVYMDYGASSAGEAGEKLDGQVLLDYGAFDAGSNQVRQLMGPLPVVLCDCMAGDGRPLCREYWRRNAPGLFHLHT